MKMLRVVSLFAGLVRGVFVNTANAHSSGLKASGCHAGSIPYYTENLTGLVKLRVRQIGRKPKMLKQKPRRLSGKIILF